MRRLTIGIIGGALTIASCGDQSPDTATSANGALVTTDTRSSKPAPTLDEADGGQLDTGSEPGPNTTIVTEPAPAPLGGREFNVEVRPESAAIDNPLPDLIVDDVGRGVRANIANILPSDRPVLVWAWAPH